MNTSVTDSDQVGHKLYLTSWHNQNLSRRALNTLTVSTQINTEIRRVIAFVNSIAHATEEIKIR